MPHKGAILLSKYGEQWLAADVDSGFIGPADRSKAREQINCWLIVVSAEESDA
jgi:hypothetical protein